MTRSLAVASILLMLVCGALAGCGSNDGPAGPTEAEVEEMVERKGEEIATVDCVEREGERLFGCTVEIVEWPSSIVRAEIRVSEEDSSTYFVEDCEASGPEWAKPEELCRNLD